MLDPTLDNSEPDYPFPPRYWWLKRLIALSILLIVAYAGAWKWWTWQAQMRFDAAVAAIKARGEPILIEDFAVKTVPDELNAAHSLSTAALWVRLTTPQDQFFNGAYNRDNAIDAASLDMMRQIVEVSSKPLELARLARFQPEVEWGVRMKSPVMAVLLPALNSTRRLSTLLSLAAHYQHLTGHDAAAVEIARDMVRQSDLMELHSPALVAHFVAAAQITMTADTVRIIAYDLDVQRDAAATTQPAGPASRKQVKALIAELLDDRLFRRGMERGVYGERLMQYDMAANHIPFAAIGIGAPPIEKITPLVMADAARSLILLTRIVDSAKAPDYPTAMSLMPNIPQMRQDQTTATVLARLPSQLLMPSLDRALLTSFRALAARRIAAIRLAIRLYQLDHDGNYPQHLEELVGAYLPALPADPFATNGKPFGYRLAPEPMIYSVNQNGIDEAGDTTPTVTYWISPKIKPGSPQDDYVWSRRDAIFPLDKPPPPPATAPSDAE